MNHLKKRRTHIADFGNLQNQSATYKGFLGPGVSPIIDKGNQGREEGV